MCVYLCKSEWQKLGKEIDSNFYVYPFVSFHGMPLHCTLFSDCFSTHTNTQLHWKMYKNAFGYYSVFIFTILYATLLSLSTTITIFCFPFNEQQLRLPTLLFSTSSLCVWQKKVTEYWYTHKREQTKGREKYKSISFMDRKHERYFIFIST